MHIISVNIGKSQPFDNAKKSGVTGIYKHPSAERVNVTATGLAGDDVCDVANHGGPDQAVYVYGTPDYEWWSRELGRELAPGTFGENLTIAGLESAQLSIGDRLHTSSVTLEVTAPRIPCSTLARRMDDPAFVKRFRAAERPGVYCRVIRTGFVQAGDAVTLEPYAGSTISAIEMFREYYTPVRDASSIRAYLAAPIAVRARADKQQQLEKLLAQQAESI